MPDALESGRPVIPFRNIVLATDFLESSRLALDYAVAFAHHYGAKLTIVHAFQLPPEAEQVEMVSHLPSISREHATARLEAFASGIKRLGIHTEIELRTDLPCPAVLSSTIMNNADLLVLGTHGIYRGLEHMIIGSDAEKILLAAPCPTLTVGRHVMAGVDLDLKFRKILLISDMSQEAVAAAQYAESLARDLGIPAELIPVPADDDAIDSEDVQGAIERSCANLHSQPGFANHEWSDPAYHLKRLVSTQDIIQRLMICNDSLIILGAHNESRWKRHLHASFAFKLIARSGCPVLSVHGR